MVANSGILSSLSATPTSQLIDKIDSPHSGLFKGLHSMAQGNYALKDGATLGFAHTFTTSGANIQLALTAGKGFSNGQYIEVDALSATTINKPSSGALYHWVAFADDGDGTGTINIVTGTSDGVVPDLTVTLTPISLIKVQSTDTHSTVAFQTFTTSKTENKLSLGYTNSNAYTPMGELSASANGLAIDGTTATIVTTPHMSLGNGATNAGELRLLEDTDNGAHYTGFKAPAAVTSNAVYQLPAAFPSGDRLLQSDSSGVLTWVSVSGATLTGSTNNTITTVTGAGAIQGEANLTFDGTTLAVTGNQTITPANDVGAAALTITNQDTDQIALDIDASNIDADVIDITANALTTAKVVDISATGLTNGMLFNAATTSTVTDGGTSTLVSTAMTNDGVGSQTAKGILLDYNKTGITASGKTVNLTGMQIDIDDTVTNVGTVNITGLEIDVDFGNAGGTVKTVGLDVAVGAGGTAADTAYSALFNGGRVGIGTTTPASTLQINITGADGDTGIQFVREDSSTSEGDFLGGIGFDSTDGNVPSSILEASAFIAAYATEDHSTTDKGGELKMGISFIDDDDDTTSIVLSRIGYPTSTNATVYAGAFSRAAVAVVGAATYSPAIADSGTVIIMNNSSSIVTLPDVGATDIGVQFTIINNSGGTLTGKIVSADTTNTRFNGAGSYAAENIEDDTAKTYLCWAADNWQVIG